jgi:hypothetical protein
MRALRRINAALFDRYRLGTNIPKATLSRRVCVGTVVVVALTIWATVAVLSHFVLNSGDPLAKAGGLKPEQTIEHK